MSKKESAESEIRLTQFEKARLVGARALQLAMGAPPLVKQDTTINAVNLAFMEYEKGVIPLRVVHTSELGAA